MNSTHSLLVAAALAASAGVSLAQDTATARHRIADPSSIQARSCGLAEHDGVLVAVGADYKAAFLPTGVAFTPALGERAPHNLPLRLDLQSIRRGETVVHDGRDVEPKGGGLRVVYDHGAITERYDVGPAGIEQSFVFTGRPAGKGDLVVRCRFDAELTPVENSDGTLSFRHGELGGVHVGKVTGIAGDGARCAGTLRFAGGAIELSLPAAFVDAAALPIVLDPVIGTEFLVHSINDSYDSDCAYDETNDRYLAVWNRRYSFTDIDILAQRVNASTGALVGNLIFVDASISTVRRPRVAYVHAPQRCLVVWQRSGSPLGPWDVECRSVSAADGAMSGIVSVAATAADEFAPVVGGDATGSDDDAVVVWETDSGIQACQVTLLLPDPVPAAPVTFASSQLDNAPAITKTCGASFRHVIVWQRTQLLSDAEIVAQAVDRNLVLLGGLATVSANTLADGAPAVDGNGTTFLVAWERTESGGSTRDLVCASMTFSAGALTATRETALEATAGVDEYAPDVAILGSRFCVAYAERAAALADNCYAWLVNPNCTTCNARIVLDGLNGAGQNRESSPRIASTFMSNGDDTALITFSEALDAPPFRSQIVAQRVENLSAGAPPVSVSGPCGGGLAGTNGPFVVGNTAFQFTLSGADPAGIVFLSLGFPGPGLPCGTCSLTQPVAFEFKPNIGGSAASPFAVSCDPIYVGTTLEFQWVSFNTAVNSCPAAPGLATTRRLQVTLQN